MDVLMADNDENLLRTLKKCFTVTEWPLVMQHKPFAEATENLNTLEDVQHAAELGADFLFMLVGGNKPHTERRDRN
jgi:hypothetical protein